MARKPAASHCRMLHRTFPSESSPLKACLLWMSTLASVSCVRTCSRDSSASVMFAMSPALMAKDLRETKDRVQISLRQENSTRAQPRSWRVRRSYQYCFGTTRRGRITIATQLKDNERLNSILPRSWTLVELPNAAVSRPKAR